MTIRVLVAEDQAAVRAALVMILRAEPEFEVVGQAADGEEAVRLALELRPDVVLMDVQMPRLDGVSATREVVAAGAAQVLVLTTFDLDEYVYGALRAGAAGFLLKDLEADTLVEGIRTVARGDGMLAPSVTRRLIGAFARPERQVGPEAREAVAGLTGREREVLACLGTGMSNGEIAARLEMAEATTKTHVSRILAKLRLRSRVQAAILAQDLGLTI
ncbi:LuxR family two component transcriptional regulator [Streptomyces sp. 1114.5]|uniref:response regulator n=1 Tax=unclassified Streptomyces TaxID=2593676 RepID=UPI000BDD221C|nr:MULTISPECIES: response regulator transcription factor [unclassified Streptomyces]RKT15884.1 LuxR family two component transcriptional regulator [Streptomyces sp. 1114.5]SOB82058.1 two component transcriptional regulator, LuxR family [Streptomyces sp. 1331.2]